MGKEGCKHMPLKTMSEHYSHKSHVCSEMVASLFLRTSLPGKASALRIKAYILSSFDCNKRMDFFFSHISKSKAALA